MSIVGPRPLLVEYLPYYTKEEKRYYPFAFTVLHQHSIYARVEKSIFLNEF